MKKLNQTVLHIDDDPTNRYIVKKILEKEGYSVIEAKDGAEGIVKSLRIPDLIILDIQLPDMTGFEVCRIIKSNPLTASIPLLQTSASYISAQHKVTGLDSGADGYLIQPLQGPVLLATVRSLLRTKSAEQRAVKATRARDEMLAIVTHDLRTPLSFIMLQSKALSKNAETERFDLENHIAKLNKITESCHRMNRLIKDLMDISQIDEGKFQLNIQTMKCHKLASDVLEAFSDLIKDADLKLTLNACEKDLMFQGDNDRLLQMLGNLITNSIKFTEAGGKITLSFSISDQDLIIELEDTGKGIEKKDLEHIFNRYWQEKYERRESLGLGLCIVKGIVDAHGGKIDLESHVGKGTKFNISIPLITSGPEQILTSI